MYKTFRALITLVWIADILNLPQVEMLDTTYPINFLAWLLIFMFIPSTTLYIKDANNLFNRGE